MLILGIDPGSIKTGWAMLEKKGRKVRYISSGVLKFNSKMSFLQRTKEIKEKSKNLIKSLSPNQVVFESLIYVKSPTALIKLSQTRGLILSECIDFVGDSIFEYSPNFVKSTTTGHGHASKESVQKFIKMNFGISKFETHDESDAIIIALCHCLSGVKLDTANMRATSNKGRRTLKDALSHKIL